MPALGYVTGYAALQRALAGALERTAVRVLAGCTVLAVRGDADGAVVSVDASGARKELATRLIAIADGGAQLDVAHVRTRDYRQSALVCDVVSEQLHQNRAFERFTPDGPIALLPSARGWSLVWTVAPERAQQLATLDENEFCGQLQAGFGAAAGVFTAASRPQVFPLALKVATRPVAPRTLLIGNAAQTLHPVAGQGFNLGLRDAWELARAILARGERDPGPEPATGMCPEAIRHVTLPFLLECLHVVPTRRARRFPCVTRSRAMPSARIASDATTPCPNWFRWRPSATS